jgi:MFS family permease
MAPNLTAIATDFGFDDVERDMKLGGQIPFAFFIVGGAISLVIGPMADWMDRRKLFVAVVLIGNIPCLLTYWVTSYWQFFLLRMLTGISIGGAIPVIFSLFSDMFPPSQRLQVSSGIGASIGIGTALGQIVAGFVGPSFGWRLPFVIVSLPSLVLAVLVCFFIVDPRHADPNLPGNFLSVDSGYKGLQWGTIRAIFKIKTNQMMFAQCIPGCLPWGVINTYLTDYLHERGLSVEGSTMVVIVFGIGCLFNLSVGGSVGQRLYNKKKGYLGIWMGFACLAGIPPVLYLIHHEWVGTEPTFVPLCVAFLAGIAAVVGPNSKACLMNCNSQRVRGTVFSVNTIMDDLGKGLGPALVAWMISIMGRKYALTLGILGWMPCSFFLFMSSYSLAEDEEAVKQG